MKNSIPVLIQARQSSSRLPSKVMTPFCGNMKMIEFQYLRLKEIFDNVTVATSVDKSDNEMCEYLKYKGINYYRGSLNNVMQRLIDCYDKNACSTDEWFVRVGGDDPLVSTTGIELMAKKIEENSLNKNVAMYYSSYDDGMIYGCAVEFFRTSKYREVLNYVNQIETDEHNKRVFQEHTKPAFTNESILNATNSIRVRAKIPENYKLRQIFLSVDHGEDFLLTSYIANNLYNIHGLDFSHEQLMECINTVNDKLLINRHLHNGFGE